MANCIFIASPDSEANKAMSALSAVRFYLKNGLKVAYFKTIATSDSDPQIKLALRETGLNYEELHNLYGLTLDEALAYLNHGAEHLVIENILAKFMKLQKRFDFVVVEGATAEGAACADILSLDAFLAATLQAPVIMVSEIEHGGKESVSAAVNFYQKRHAQVLACALITPFPDNVKSLSGLEPLKNVDICSLRSGVDFGVYLEKSACLFKDFASTVMTPKRFEFNIIEMAAAKKQTIVLPEGNDERILRAADNILQRDFANLIILGKPDDICEKAKSLKLQHIDKATLIDIETCPWKKEFASQYFELRKHKGMTEEKAFSQMSDRNFFATMMIYAKKADGMVSGADGTTADTIRPSLSIIKTKPGCSIASSVFLMCMDDKVMVYGDCAVNPNPNPQQLAEIAIMSAKTAKAFGVEPKVAMLSYSSGNSGMGPDVDAVKEATQLAREISEKAYPGLALDGPIQFDAAVDQKTASSKMPNSPVAGQATVMIFPDLNSGNIGYKAVQRSSGAVAIGPVIQGLNAPVNDLSRGCTVADIINTVAITAIQAAQEKN